MKKEEMKSMNMAQLLEALNNTVDKYNEATDASTKVALEVEAGNLAKQYNEAAKLTVYAEALKDAMPVAAIVKKHHYGTYGAQFKPVVDLVDGKPVAKKSASVKAGTKNIDLFDFIEWAEAKNKKVCNAPDWKTVMNTQRTRMIKEFTKAAKAETVYNVSKTTANDVLQNVFNAIIFVPGESGKNAIFPNKDCKNLIVSTATEYKETVTDGDDVDVSLTFLNNKKWKGIIQSALFLVLKNKTIKYIYGEPEAEANNATVKIATPNSKEEKPDNDKKPEANKK